MSRNRYRSSNHPDSGPEPIFEGFQLIGASMFLRFAEQLLHRRRRKENGLAYLGLCVSGQKIADLLSRIKSGFAPVSRKVILMIGTNDLLQNTHESRMVQGIEELVSKLRKDVQTLLILTLPPVPRLAQNASHWKRIRIFNDRIKALDNGDDVFVVDVYKELVKKRTPKRSSTCSHPDTSRTSNSSRNSSIPGRDSRGSLGYNSDFENHRVKREPKDGSPTNDSFNRSYSSSSTKLVCGKSLDGPVGPRLKCAPIDSPSKSPDHLRPRKQSRDNELDDLPVKKEERYSTDLRPNGIFSHTMSEPRPQLSYNGDLNIKLDIKEDDKGTVIQEFRTVYEKRVAKQESRADPESCETSYESRRSQFTTSSRSSTSLKRKRTFSSLYDSPPAKRKSFSYVEDDHDDTFGEEDSYSQIEGFADEINLDCFEEYFSQKTGRKDLIHLNNYGLRIIRRLVSEKIRSLRKYR